MPIRPYGDLEEWKPVELVCRARYLYQKDPSEKNLQQLNRLLAQYPAENHSYQESTQENPRHSEEKRIFCDGYPLAIVPHLRYSRASWHSHDFYELIYVYRGQCEHLLKGNILKMHQGDFCILPPNQIHAIQCNWDHGIIVNILIRKSTFHQSFCPLLSDYGLLSSFFSHTLFQKENSAYLLFRCGDDPVIHSQVLSMYNEYISFTPYSKSILVGQLMQLLGCVMRSHQFDVIQMIGKNGDQSAHISKILQYIETHLSGVTLHEVAQTFNYSDGRCSSLIKEATGKTFTEILREEKSHCAARLLLEKDWSLTRIAEEAGFYDTSHFYKTFSGIYGVTPAQYRKQHVPKKL